MVLRSDLPEHFGYDLLGLEDGYLDPNDEEALVARGLEQMSVDATHVVLQWGTDGVWRPGEDWIGDALGAGRMSFRPQPLEPVSSTKPGTLFDHATDSIQGLLTVDSLTVRNGRYS